MGCELEPRAPQAPCSAGQARSQVHPALGAQATFCVCSLQALSLQLALPTHRPGLPTQATWVRLLVSLGNLPDTPKECYLRA